MLTINYDPDKGKAIRDGHMTLTLREGLMRTIVPANQGKQGAALHVSSLFFVQFVLNEIKTKSIKPNEVKFLFNNYPVKHTNDGRFIGIPKQHNMRQFEDFTFPPDIKY